MKTMFSASPFGRTGIGQTTWDQIAEQQQVERAGFEDPEIMARFQWDGTMAEIGRLLGLLPPDSVAAYVSEMERCKALYSKDASSRSPALPCISALYDKISNELRNAGRTSAQTPMERSTPGGQSTSEFPVVPVALSAGVGILLVSLLA